MEGDDMEEDEFLNECLQFALENANTDDRYAYLMTQQTASLDLIDYYSLRFSGEIPDKNLVMRRRDSYLDYNVVENITVVGLSSKNDPEPVEVVSHDGNCTVNLGSYEAIDIIVMLGSTNPTLLTVELQETISCGRTRRSPRVMSRSAQA